MKALRLKRRKTIEMKRKGKEIKGANQEEKNRIHQIKCFPEFVCEYEISGSVRKKKNESGF